MIVEDTTYAQLQRVIHDALRAQHPDWILPNGDCPTCDSYESRFAELLMQLRPTGSLELELGKTHQSRYKFRYQPRVGTTHHAR